MTNSRWTDGRILEELTTRYRWVLVLLLLGLGAFFAAKTVNAFVYRSLRELPTADAPVRALPTALHLSPQAVSPSGQARTVLERNLFQARREDLIKQAEANKPREPSNQIMPCSIGPNLAGILYTGKAEYSYVMYRDPKTQEASMYAPRPGKDQIPGDITLLEISPNEAKFRKDDHIEVCILGDDGKTPVNTAVQQPVDNGSTPSSGGDSAEGITKVSENEYAIENRKIQWVQEHLNEVATDARIVPAFSEGKSIGFKLFSIRPNSVYQQIGLQNGDVIQKINGYEMTDPAKALEIYGKLQNVRSLNVQIERRGVVKNINYNIR